MTKEAGEKDWIIDYDLIKKKIPNMNHHGKQESERTNVWNLTTTFTIAANERQFS